MSVVEYNFIDEKKSVPAKQATGSSSRVDKKHKAHERDIFRRIRTRDICMVARQLATLLRAGMPLVPALSALVEQSRGVKARDNHLAEITEQVAHDVNSGSTLANALGKHPKVFSNLFINMVAAGETSGALEEVLFRLAEILEKRVNLAAKVKSAIAYPLMMVIVAVAVVVFLMSVVVPSITEIFIEMNRTLPWPTLMLISTSNFIRTYWTLIAASFCLAFLGAVAS